MLGGFITRKTAVRGPGTGQRIVRTTCARKRKQSFFESRVIMSTSSELNITPRFAKSSRFLTSSHFQNVKETKTSEVMREVLEKFQVPRGGS